MPPNLAQNWESEFPGVAPSLSCLREAVIRAEQIALQSRAAFDHLNQRLDATSIPMHNWPARVLHRFLTLKRSQAIDSRQLTIAIRALNQAFTAAKTAQAKEAKAVPPVAAEPPYIPLKPVGLQTIGIEVRDGQIISNVFPDAAFFLTHGVVGRNSRVIRQFEFKDAVIPEPYAWVLTHDGVTHEPVDQISMTYSPEEFERLCRLEIDTQSEHLLDGGTRLRYQVHPSSPEFLKEIKDYEDQKKAEEKLVIHQQWIDITKNGEDQTSLLYPPNDEFNRMMDDMDPKPDLIYRRLNFVNGVPKQYMWTNPDLQAKHYGGHALIRIKLEEWPAAMEQERLYGNKFVVPPVKQQPRPEQFGPCPCPRCTEKREAEYRARQ